jgi:class 3 adenylate cyclase
MDIFIMSRSPRQKTSPERESPSYYKLCRLLVFVAIVIALLGNVIDNPLSDTLTLGLAAIALAYAFISYSVYYTSRKASTLSILAFGDGLIAAFAVSLWLYSPWPSLFLASLLYFNALYHGGFKRWLALNLGVMTGVGVSYFALGNTAISLNSHPIVNFSLLIGGLCFFCLYAFYYRKQAASTEVSFQKLNDEIKNQKLRIYEISQFLPKSVWDQIEGKKKPKIERKPITIFFSDIVGFSSLSEELEAETLSNVLSSYLAEMSKIVAQFNGTIVKFIGEAIMVTFGDDSGATKGVKADAIACVSMAIAMGKRMRELQSSWAEMGIKKPLQIRIGVNSGYCTVGTFGTSQHLDRTALGVHVNLASRLESAGQPEEILISHETWSLIKDTILCKDKGHIKAKGFTHPVQVYKVINHRKELGSKQSYFSENADGFSIHLDLEKVKNYDREKVISALELAAKKLKDK